MDLRGEKRKNEFCTILVVDFGLYCLILPFHFRFNGGVHIYNLWNLGSLTREVLS